LAVTLQRQALFWVLALLVFAILLYGLSGVLLPFVAGLALAYLLDPVADRLERLGLSRLIATLLILGIVLILFIAALVLILPLLAGQLMSFIDKLPGYVQRLQTLAVEQGGPLLERFGGGKGLNDLRSDLGGLMSQGANWLIGVLQSIWAGGQAVLSLFSLLVVTPIVAFYLLVDYDKLVASVDDWLPRRHQATVRKLALEMDATISGFLRGQALVCLFLALWYGIGLSLIGLNFGFLIGILSGILSFIPYVGSLTGLVLGLGIAIVQFWPDGFWIAAVIAVFASGQFLEGNILAPKLVGEAVGLHPVWLMFALFAFGSLFGFVGLLLAVPLAAVAGVLLRHALGLYLQSVLYHGGLPREKDEIAP
jgi:predicted PurR-regulated permease PerM